MMNKFSKTILVPAVIAATLNLTSNSYAQAQAEIGGAPITHVAVVVEDIEKAVAGYADAFGLSKSSIQAKTLNLPNGSQVELKSASVSLPNFRVEINQPISESGPIHEYLEEFGPGIHRIGFAVNNDINDTRALLQARGGTWTGGSTEDDYAFIDFRELLGTTIELITHTMASEANSASATQPVTALGTHAVTHVGFAVRDADQAVQAYADVLGIPQPQVNEYKGAQYPPESNWSYEAYLRLTSWQQENIGIEIIAPVGSPNPWSDYIERYKGNAAQHIAINVGDQMQDMVDELQTKGGEWTNGKEGGTYAYLDFSESLGIVFEVNGTARD